MSQPTDLGIGSLKPTKTTMKAQQFDPRDGKMHLNEVPIPSPKPHELLVKIDCASLCHSDVLLFKPNEGLQLSKDAVPITMGHEATGRVVSAGADVKTGLFKEGDAVGFICAEGSCFECLPCRTVHNLWCERGEQRMAGFAADGYFAEYAVVDHRNAMILPPPLSPRSAAPLFCAGVTAFHAIDGLALPPGSWVAVIGCGGLGHLAIRYAKAMGLRVVGLDIAAGALEEARECGADHVFDTTEAGEASSYVGKVLEVTGGRGVDAAVNFTASRRAYEAMPAIIKPATGIWMAVGVPSESVSVNVFDIALGRFRVMGANNGTCYNMGRAVEFSARHGVVPSVEYFALEDLPGMVARMEANEARGRMAVRFD